MEKLKHELNGKIKLAKKERDRNKHTNRRTASYFEDKVIKTEIDILELKAEALRRAKNEIEQNMLRKFDVSSNSRDFERPRSNYSNTKTRAMKDIENALSVTYDNPVLTTKSIFSGGQHVHGSTLNGYDHANCIFFDRTPVCGCGSAASCSAARGQTEGILEKCTK